MDLILHLIPMCPLIYGSPFKASSISSVLPHRLYSKLFRVHLRCNVGPDPPTNLMVSYPSTSFPMPFSVFTYHPFFSCGHTNRLFSFLNILSVCSLSIPFLFSHFLSYLLVLPTIPHKIFHFCSLQMTYISFCPFPSF